MSTKHTPGPWRTMPKSEHSTNVGIYTADGSLIATVQRSGSTISFERRAADAELLAAAPELLEALRLVAASSFLPTVGTTRAAVEAAIAKAEEKS